MGDKSHMQQAWVLSCLVGGVLRPQVDTAEGGVSALGEPHLKPASDGTDGNGIWWVLWKFQQSVEHERVSNGCGFHITCAISQLYGSHTSP